MTFPNFAADHLRRMDALAEDFRGAATEDVLRVFAAAGHELVHRNARLTPEALGRALRDEVDRIHREGLCAEPAP